MNNDPAETLAKEAGRLNRHIEGKQPIEDKSVPTYNTNVWHITLAGFPTDPGAPVELTINGKNVFTSNADGNDVSANFEAEIAGFSGNNDFVLTVHALEGCVVNKKLTTRDGVFLKFEFLPKGLSFVQQNKPF